MTICTEFDDDKMSELIDEAQKSSKINGETLSVEEARKLSNKVRANTYASKFISNDMLFKLIRAAIQDEELLVVLPSVIRNLRISYEQVKELIKLGYRVTKGTRDSILVSWDTDDSWLIGYNIKQYRKGIK